MNLGSMNWSLSDQNSFNIVEPGIADAQIDPARCALICTTSSDFISPGPLGDKSLHTGDWSLYYNNVKDNGRKRCAVFLGHEPR